MPSSGLPASLESLLRSLFEANTLSSFKIESKEEKTFVVLRLTSVSGEQHGAKSDSHTVTAFRRKSPAQVARDKRRAEQHRLNKTKASDSPNSAFLSTPPQQNCDSATTKRTDKRITSDARAFRGRVDNTGRELVVNCPNASDNTDPTGLLEDCVVHDSPVLHSTVGLQAPVENSLWKSRDQEENVVDSHAAFYHKTLCFQCSLKSVSNLSPTGIKSVSKIGDVDSSDFSVRDTFNLFS
jgi:hypothetical protein